MPWIAQDQCSGCGICVRECPVDAIVMENQVAEIDDEKCIRCGKCHDICPVGAARHDGERLPLLVAANQQYVMRLLGHYELEGERTKLLTKLTRHFGNQGQVAAQTVAWINANTDMLSARGAASESEDP